MKTNILFERLAHVVLMLAVACNFLVVPNQAVSAKPLAIIDCNSQTEIPPAECLALVALYTSTNGANWSNNTGWLQTDTPCSWFGIACNSGPNVTSLSLAQNNLFGPIPSQLENLTNLTTLMFYKNGLTGPIPPELGNLANLAMLDLSGNNLSGSIPPELGSLANLTTLDLSGTYLSGSIPPELGSLTNLTTLDLSGIDLISGSIPPELGGMTNLTTLDLSGNDLNGALPSELSGLTNLTELYLNSNAFSGSIPSELSSLTNLTILYLGGNTWSGSIPPELGSLTNLTTLNLSGAGLSGPIPPELGGMTNLTTLILDHNSLSGSIPPEIGNLTNLKGLVLNRNTLSGSIPAELGNLTLLTSLDLYDNALTGPIPPELGSLTNLKMMDLRSNALSGSIPIEVGSMTSLTNLDLSGNRLSGEIPASITNLVSLAGFSFDCELTSTDPDVVAFIDGVTPGWQSNTCPVLTSPPESAVLDNGRTDLLDDIIWDFDWSDVPGATNYQLYVERASAPTPEIDLSDIIDSSYHHVRLNSHIAAPNLAGWQWKVRAYINDQWGEWSEIRPFSVEPPNLDAPQVLAKNGGLNTYTGPARIPTFWKAVNFAATDGKSTNIKQESAASVKISGAVGKLKTLSQTLKISGPAGDRFIFSYWVKGSAVPAGNICQGKVSFYQGTQLKGAKTLKCPTGAAYNFKKRTLAFPAPAAYNKVVITFTYNKPGGTIWLDAVSLIR